MERGHKIPGGAEHFRFRGKRYIVDPKSTIREKIFGIPVRVKLLYFEGFSKPVTWPNPKGQPVPRNMSATEFDGIYITKVLKDIGKQARGPFPWKTLIIGVIVLAVLAGALQYLGVIGT